MYVFAISIILLTSHQKLKKDKSHLLQVKNIMPTILTNEIIISKRRSLLEALLNLFASIEYRERVRLTSLNQHLTIQDKPI